MDWSLVLMSQGIAASIECSEEAGWELAVAPADYENALQTLRQYRIENRRWPWSGKLVERGLIFDWSSLAWGFLVCFFYLLSEKRADLTAVGFMDSGAVRHGQWWRLLTAIWLHADLAHLAGNVTFGIVLLGLAMARYGTGVTLLASSLGGVGGNLAALILSTHPHHSLGASGMVMGCLGLLAVDSFHLWRRIPRATNYVATRLAGGLMLFILLGVAPGTDILAHLGGFISGILLGSLASLVPKLVQKPGINLASGLAFALLVAWPWWLALL
jgi:membrane associated rhomboid family serine protease